MAKNKLHKIAITTGDQDGIGPEVTAKALHKIGPKKGVQFFLWRSSNFDSRYLRLIDKKFKRVTVTSWPEALRAHLLSKKYIVDICSPLPPPQWVEMATHAALLKTVDALVTAPLSKTLIVKSGLKDVGHTQIFERLSQRSDLFMAFLGQKFHLVLATGHVSLSQVKTALTPDRLELSLRAAHHLASALKPHRPKLALIGLNPHAGEGGLIGTEEVDFFAPCLEKLRQEKLSILGPLVPDAAFLRSTQKVVDVYVSPYHDQGLIPFKMVHERRGCHLTLGLPFVRTSVDHGTAKDIAGKNKADPSSMQEALSQAIILSQNSFKPDFYTAVNSAKK